MGEVRWPLVSAGEGSLTEFVRFWDRLYSGYDEDFYRRNIGQPLTPERIAGWFEWKNGTPLSANKAQAVRRYASEDERIGHDAGPEALAAFLDRPGGAIWRIFWLHLQHPTHFPIYDRHVHRAMAFLLKWPALELPVNNPQKVRSYLEHYRPFFRRFHEFPCRQADRALGRSVGSWVRTTAHS
jgi:hypothetical protein